MYFCCMTTAYALPEDLMAANNLPVGDLILFDYQTTNQQPVKTKIIASKHVFSFLQEGEKEVHFYDESVRFNPSKAMLIPAGNCIMTERYSQDRQYRSFIFIFSDSHLVAFRDKYVSLFTHAPRNSSERLSHFLFAQDDFIRNFVHSLQHLHCHPTTLSASLLQIKFDEVMLYLCDRYPQQFLRFIFNVNTSDLPLRKVVESKTSLNLSLEELSFLCNMSVSTFKRKFEEVYGMAPSRWFHLRKMQQAAFLLKYEKAKASEIHLDLGYENLSSFVQAFKKEFGKTPKAYQQNV